MSCVVCKEDYPCKCDLKRHLAAQRKHERQADQTLAVDLRVKRNREVFTVAGEIFALLDDLEDDQREEVISLVAEWASDREIPMKVKE